MNCAGCSCPIAENVGISALGRTWHDDCLKCICCECRLVEAGPTFYYKYSMLLCTRDYLRIFGTSGKCTYCEQRIPPYEWVMRVQGDKTFHLRCFVCHKCNVRFCIGERFYLNGNRILCEEECNTASME